MFGRDDWRPDSGRGSALSAYLSTEYKDVVSFALLILVLLKFDAYRYSGSSGGRESRGRVHFAGWLLLLPCFFRCPGVFMSVQLKLGGTACGDTAADIRWQWVLSAPPWCSVPAAASAVPENAERRPDRSLSCGYRRHIPPLQKLSFRGAVGGCGGVPFVVSRGTVDIAT